MSKLTYFKRTWAEIDLDHFKHNIQLVQKSLPVGTKMMAVIKADAYGHGDRQMARTLVENGVDFFAVSNFEEAKKIRQDGVKGAILILGFTGSEYAKELAAMDIIQAVFSVSYGWELAKSAAQAGVKIKVHIKLDTGMGRIGFLCVGREKECAAEIVQVAEFESLDCCGIFSHFSSADMLDDASDAYTAMQQRSFDRTVQALRERGVELPCVHLQNSAGIIRELNHGYAYARAGIILYGVDPSPQMEKALPLLPVMAVKTTVALVKTLQDDYAVSYGRHFVATVPTKVATVPIGYADGYPRLLSGKGAMLVNGVKCPILGNICMDQLMLDVSGAGEVKAGDIVTVMGVDGAQSITADDLANAIGTIGYEILCMVSKRVPRVYLQGNQVVQVVDYLDD